PIVRSSDRGPAALCHHPNLPGFRPPPPARTADGDLLFRLWHFPLHLRILPRTRRAVPGARQHGHGAFHPSLADSRRPVRVVVEEDGMNALETRIAALIAAQGPISVAQYMSLALHDAEAGYYATRQPFGGAGDFITAPEISQMFGELLGLWCVQVWHDQEQPRHKRLVELGPGRGTMMADVLRAVRAAPDFAEGLEVVMVEASPALQKLQAKKLE